jgi:hypothetical protein
MGRGIGEPAATEEWCGDGTPEAFVISHNLHRRHLSEGQRALIAARLATRTREETLVPGGPSRHPELEVQINITSISAARAADMLNVSRASAATASV